MSRSFSLITKKQQRRTGFISQTFTTTRRGHHSSASFVTGHSTIVNLCNRLLTACFCLTANPPVRSTTYWLAKAQLERQTINSFPTPSNNNLKGGAEARPLKRNILYRAIPRCCSSRAAFPAVCLYSSVHRAGVSSTTVYSCLCLQSAAQFRSPLCK